LPRGWLDSFSPTCFSEGILRSAFSEAVRASVAEDKCPPESNLGGDSMRKAVIEKRSGKMYFSPDAGSLVLLNAVARNDGLILVVSAIAFRM